jgi:hypothetical protein
LFLAVWQGQPAKSSHRNLRNSQVAVACGGLVVGRRHRQDLSDFGDAAFLVMRLITVPSDLLVTFGNSVEGRLVAGTPGGPPLPPPTA